MIHSYFIFVIIYWHNNYTSTIIKEMVIFLVFFKYNFLVIKINHLYNSICKLTLFSIAQIVSYLFTHFGEIYPYHSFFMRKMACIGEEHLNLRIWLVAVEVLKKTKLTLPIAP